MTNYLLSPLGSKRQLLSNNAIGSGGTHDPVLKLASLGQLVREDKFSAAAPHEQKFVARKSKYQYPGACGNSEFLVYQDPLSALASGKYASTNLAVTTTVPPISPNLDRSLSSKFHEFGPSVEDYLMSSSVDSLVGATSPQQKDDISLSFRKFHEAETIYKELDTVTDTNLFSAEDGGGGGAKGFELSRNICGDEERIAILEQLQDPETKQATTATDRAQDAAKIGLQHERMEAMKLVAERLKSSGFGNKSVDRLRENTKEVKASLHYQKLGDGINLDQEKVVKLQQQGGASPGITNNLWPQEEPCEKGTGSRRNCNSWSNNHNHHPCDAASLPRFAPNLKRDSHEDDESVLKSLSRGAAAGCQGGGLLEVAAVKNVGDGQARDIHQNSGHESLHSSSIGQCSPFRKHKRMFPEAVAMGSLQNRAPWPRAYEDHSLAAPLQPPHVQDFLAMRDSSFSSRKVVAETHDSGCHQTLKWSGAAYRSPDVVLHASDPSPAEINTAAKKNNPSSSPSVSLAQDPFQRRISCSTPLDETPAENQTLTRGTSYSETNGLITQLMSTEQSPYLQVPALTTNKPIKPSPSRELQTMEDDTLGIVSLSNTNAKKRSRSLANEQLPADSNEFPSSKRQEVTTEPCSTSTLEHELELCHSSVPGVAPAAGDLMNSNVSVSSATPVVPYARDLMEVEDWINLLAAGLGVDPEEYTHQDDGFFPMEINTGPQSPMSDFTGGMAMLFDYM
ncbi:unnamed protein product [Sphagnum jensenii]|uniref:Uncharacterized protein n=1 Tax=Sphagnum jensenii TaxID=128206 RepID=A0ABP0X3Z8_9BRYO